MYNFPGVRLCPLLMREANTTPAPVRDSDQALDIVRRYSGRVDWQGEGKEKEMNFVE
jgi:hypothetical protein